MKKVKWMIESQEEFDKLQRDARVVWWIIKAIVAFFFLLILFLVIGTIFEYF